jgi:predicted metalloprotease with PDZ domain
VPYDFEDVVSALNKVQPYEWSRFLREKLDTTEPEAPLEGLTQGGWKLSYSETASDYFKASEKARKHVDRMDSIGVVIGNDDDNKGKLIDVLWQGPAFAAGLAPAMKIVAVDGESYSPERLDDAIKAAESDKSPIELLVQNVDYFTTYKLDYHDGPKFPKLVRGSGPDRLSLIGKARK